MTIIGTRPEIIRLSRVMARLDEHVDHVIVHTGQNYDFELNQVFFDDLEVRKPDHYLEVDTSSLGRVYGEVLIKSEEVLRSEQPDAVLILGDTNSSISALMARRLKIPVFHMEAGNRSFDWAVPEETNRRVADHISNYNLAYTEHARRNLLAEGIHPERIYLTGSPMREVLDYYRPQIDASTVLQNEGLDRDGYFVVSVHREENVSDSANLPRLVTAMNLLARTYRLPVVVSTHPRTRGHLDEFAELDLDELVQLHAPFGFHDYNHLQLHSRCVISDSGTISEESAILDFRAVTPRTAMERPEALDAGTVTMGGLDPASILYSVEQAIAVHAEHTPTVPPEYQISDTSIRVLRIITSKTLSRR